jgi:hypothetical protein
MPACSQCGETPPTDATGEAVLLGWMVERGRDDSTTVVCPACAHRHARAIEGGLDQAWW